MRTLTLVLTAMISTLAVADWPQFLGPDRNGVTEGGRIARTWPEGGPKELWRFDLGPGFGGAAISGGKVYVLDRVPRKEEVLRCLDLATGKEDWTFAYEETAKDVPSPGSRSTPAVDDKCVYTVGCFGAVHCVDKETHKAIWSHNLLKDFGDATKLPVWGVTQSPVLYKDLVIVAPQNKKVGVLAYKKADGEVAWQSQPIGSWDTAYASPAVFTVAGKETIVMLSQVAGKGRVNVVGIDPADGKVLWTFDKWACGIPIPSPVWCGEDRFFLTGGYDAGSAMFQVEKKGDQYVTTALWNDKGRMRGADGKDKPGEEKAKERETMVSGHLHNALFYKGHLYLNGNSVQNSGVIGLVCLDLTGKILWKTDKKPGFDMGDAILVDDLILAMDGANPAGGTLRLVQASPDAYKQLAEAKVLDQKKTVWACMSFSDGKLIVRDNRTMKCLDLRGQ